MALFKLLLTQGRRRNCRDATELLHKEGVDVITTQRDQNCSNLQLSLARRNKVVKHIPNYVFIPIMLLRATQCLYLHNSEPSRYPTSLGVSCFKTGMGRFQLKSKLSSLSGFTVVPFNEID